MDKPAARQSLSMYDFRQKRRPGAAKTRRPVTKKVTYRHASPARAVVATKASVRKRILPRRPSRSPKTSMDSATTSLVKTLGSVALAMIIIGICAYFFITKVATYLWPLQTPQTLLLVPEVTAGQPMPYVQLAVLDPQTQTVQMAELNGSVPLTAAGDVQVSSLASELQATSTESGKLSLKLGRVVDEVITLPKGQTLRNHAEIKHVFQDLMQADTPTISAKDKIRWWLFVLSLSDTDVRIKNIVNLSNWQAWLASISQAQPTTRCSLALINTTPTSGLSRFMSQVMEQSGYQVIKVDSQPKFLEKSQLFINPNRPECQVSAQRLQQFLPEKIEVVPDAATTQQARADIVWLLGNDVAKQAIVLME